MRVNQLLSILGLAALGLSAIAPNASAAPVAAKDGKGDIYISGLTDYQTLKVEYASIPRSRSLQANECGFIRLRSSDSYPFTSSTALKVEGGSEFTVGSLPAEAAPRCSQGQLTGANTSPSAKLRTLEGDVYITGLTPYSSQDVTFVGLPSSRNVRANACGVARIANSGNYKITSGAVTVKNRDTDATVVTIADYSALTQVSGGPICREGATFTAEDWPGS